MIRQKVSNPHDRFAPYEQLARALSRSYGANNSAVNVLELAMRNGAFVAGGCAGVILGEYNSIEYYLHLETYRNDPIVQKNGTIPPEGMKFRRGDIDLFFETDAGRDAFLTTLEEWRIRINDPSVLHVIDSPFKRAKDIAVGSAMFQAILKTAPIEQTLESFDILNAACAFNRDEVVKHDRWDAVTEAKQIDVLNTQGFFLVNRIKKWVTKTGFKPTQRAASSAMSSAITILEAVKNTDPSEETVRGYKRSILTKDKISKMLRVATQEFHALSNEELTMLPFVINEKLWSMTPLKILTKRAQSLYKATNGKVGVPFPVELEEYY